MALTGSSAVHDPNETQLITFRDWTLRVRAADLQPARLLLLIHGWTGDENSMWVFVRHFPGTCWMVAPRAPHTTKPGGYSWRVLDGKPGRLPRLEDLRPAAADLIVLADAYAAENGLDAREFDAIGFSQGAALINALALLHPARVHRCGILAGFVPDGAETLLQGRPLEGKRFFVAHGTQDEMVSIQQARLSVQQLEQAGARVAFCEDDVGHKVGANCMRGLEEFWLS
jgi:phospholipase/carboxylesterase